MTCLVHDFANPNRQCACGLQAKDWLNRNTSKHGYNDWLLKMAEKEGGGIISVGGLVTRVKQEEAYRAAGWTTGDLSDFLELSSEEENEIVDAVNLNKTMALFNKGFVSRETIAKEIDYGC